MTDEQWFLQLLEGWQRPEAMRFVRPGGALEEGLFDEAIEAFIRARYGGPNKERGAIRRIVLQHSLDRTAFSTVAALGSVVALWPFLVAEDRRIGR